jgi:hypothetical protein
MLGLKEPRFSQNIEIMSEQCQSLVELSGFEPMAIALRGDRGPPLWQAWHRQKRHSANAAEIGG